MRILLIDDDEALCKLIEEYFDLHGVQTTIRHTGEAGLNEAMYGVYDAIILDVMLPNISGLSVLKKLINTTNIPVLMLTANGCDMDHILGLEIGADDYINKPCKPKVLLARIEAVLKRHSKTKMIEKQKNVVFKNIILNPQTRQTLVNNIPLPLTVTEFDILKTLLIHADSAVDKNTLAQLTLGRKLTRFDRSIDMHISNIRQKIQNIAHAQIAIKTIHGYGYKLEPKHET